MAAELGATPALRAAPGRVRTRQAARAMLVALAALAIASSWLVFPYLVDGTRLLSETGAQSRVLKGGRVSRYLSRVLVRNQDLELVATFGTEEFFQFVDDPDLVGDLRPDRNLVFFVNETVHAGQLPESSPAAELHVGDRVYAPMSTSGPSRADHHRVTVYTFPKLDDSGSPIDIDAAGNLRLAVSGPYLGSDRPLTFLAMWQAPYRLPESLRSGTDVPVLGVLALGAGLLSSVLTPCLLQMMLVFGSVTAGFAAPPAGATTGGSSVAQSSVRRRLLTSAVAFVLAFTVLYAAAGAVIGALGHYAQLVFAEYRAPLSALSGGLVMAFGAWMLLRSAPMVACRLPQRGSGGALSSGIPGALTSIGAALGCTVCFGGAIAGTLIVYIGAIGNAAIGAGIMAIFSLGFAIPLLLAAYSATASRSFLSVVTRYSTPIRYASATVLIGFGVILATDNFHLVSDAIYPYLGLR